MFVKFIIQDDVLNIGSKIMTKRNEPVLNSKFGRRYLFYIWCRRTMRRKKMDVIKFYSWSRKNKDKMCKAVRPDLPSHLNGSTLDLSPGFPTGPRPGRLSRQWPVSIDKAWSLHRSYIPLRGIHILCVF